MVGLTDAFGLPDFVLKAPIARYDGDIYQSKENDLLNQIMYSQSFRLL